MVRPGRDAADDPEEVPEVEPERVVGDGVLVQVVIILYGLTESEESACDES